MAKLTVVLDVDRWACGSLRYGDGDCCALGHLLEQHNPKLLDAIDLAMLDSEAELDRVTHWLQRRVDPSIEPIHVVRVSEINDAMHNIPLQRSFERRQRLVRAMALLNVDLRFSDEVPADG